MLENNAHLNLGENDMLQDFSLLAKFTKLNGIWIILYQIFHDWSIQDLDTQAFRQLSVVTLERKLCIHALSGSKVARL